MVSQIRLYFRFCVTSWAFSYPPLRGHYQDFLLHSMQLRLSWQHADGSGFVSDKNFYTPQQLWVVLIAPGFEKKFYQFFAFPSY